jgi:hypothetical protein
MALVVSTSVLGHCELSNHLLLLIPIKTKPLNNELSERKFFVRTGLAVSAGNASAGLVTHPIFNRRGRLHEPAAATASIADADFMPAMGSGLAGVHEQNRADLQRCTDQADGPFRRAAHAR